MALTNTNSVHAQKVLRQLWLLTKLNTLGFVIVQTLIPTSHFCWVYFLLYFCFPYIFKCLHLCSFLLFQQKLIISSVWRTSWTRFELILGQEVKALYYSLHIFHFGLGLKALYYSFSVVSQGLYHCMSK